MKDFTQITDFIEGCRWTLRVKSVSQTNVLHWPTLGERVYI